MRLNTPHKGITQRNLLSPQRLLPTALVVEDKTEDVVRRMFRVRSEIARLVNEEGL